MAAIRPPKKREKMFSPTQGFCGNKTKQSENRGRKSGRDCVWLLQNPAEGQSLEGIGDGRAYALYEPLKERSSNQEQ